MAKAGTIAAGRFKATCLALLDEVARSGRSYVVTKRGRPVARISPVREETASPLRGSVLKDDDIVSPLDLDWDGGKAS